MCDAPFWSAVPLSVRARKTINLKATLFSHASGTRVSVRASVPFVSFHAAHTHTLEGQIINFAYSAANCEQ